MLLLSGANTAVFRAQSEFSVHCSKVPLLGGRSTVNRYVLKLSEGEPSVHFREVKSGAS